MVRGFLAAALAAAFGVPVAAQTVPPQTTLQCDKGCTFNSEWLIDGAFDVDFTVPTEGHTYKWSFSIDQPGATFYLDYPNEIYWELDYRNRGSIVTYQPGFFRYDESIKPNLTTIMVWAPREFNFCNQPGPDGELCARFGMVWGNGSRGYFSGVSGQFVLTTKYEAVPESTSWAMMIGGFGLAGVAVRRRPMQIPQNRTLIG